MIKLWQKIGGKTGPCDLGPEEIASIFLLLAGEIENSFDSFRGPDQIAEWLREEAGKALFDWNRGGFNL